MTTPPDTPKPPADPRRVMQTITEGPHANCMQAAIASLFGIPIGEAPDLTNAKAYESNGVVSGEWVERVRAWAARRGLGFITIGCPPEAFRAEFSRGYLIASGKSKRGRYHAVVYRDGELWHDPHPDSGGLEAIEFVDYFYPLDPASPQESHKLAEELERMIDDGASCSADKLHEAIYRIGMWTIDKANEIRDALRSSPSENRRLREILAECGNAAGGRVSPECSLDFMAYIPTEIKLAIAASGGAKGDGNG